MQDFGGSLDMYVRRLYVAKKFPTFLLFVEKEKAEYSRVTCSLLARYRMGRNIIYTRKKKISFNTSRERNIRNRNHCN